MITYSRFIYLFGLLFCLIGLQCKSSHNSATRKVMYESIYIDQFKLTYFRQLLVKGFNDSKAVQEVIQFDKSGFTEPILTIDDFRLIDSLTTLDNLKMEMDSTNTIGRVAEGAEGKHPLGFILNKLDSKWLDSLANKRYQGSGVKIMYKE